MEHDPEDIWQTTIDVTTAMVAEARSRGTMPTAIGITNQRETAVIWDRTTGKPIHNGVWQDRRTADICAVMKNAGKEAMVTERQGYFSIHISPPPNLPGSLTGLGARVIAPPLASCVSAPSTASDLASNGRQDACHRRHQCQPHQPLQHHENDWDDDLLALFDVPRTGLPQVKDCRQLASVMRAV